MLERKVMMLKSFSFKFIHLKYIKLCIIIFLCIIYFDISISHKVFLRNDTVAVYKDEILNEIMVRKKFVVLINF